MEPNFPHERARRDVVRSAERREEVVERLLVREIYDGEANAHFVPFCAKDVVVANRRVEKMARLRALWIVIVVFRAGGWYLHLTG